MLGEHTVGVVSERIGEALELFAGDPHFTVVKVGRRVFISRRFSFGRRRTEPSRKSISSSAQIVTSSKWRDTRFSKKTGLMRCLSTRSALNKSSFQASVPCSSRVFTPFPAYSTIWRRRLRVEGTKGTAHLSLFARTWSMTSVSHRAGHEVRFGSLSRRIRDAIGLRPRASTP